MAQIIAVHSFRGGTGKSNTTANLAVLLAQSGLRVGVVDTDIQSPGVHVLFGLAGQAIAPTLNDYLHGQCEIEAVARPVLPDVLADRLFLIPSSIKADAIIQILREGYTIQRMTNAFRELIDARRLDVLLIDSHPGLNEETLYALAIAQTLVLVLRPDQQDYEGTAVTLEVARSLDVPRVLLLINKAPRTLADQALRQYAETAFACPVAAVLPHCDEMLLLGSADIFALRFPKHPLTVALRLVAFDLVSTGVPGPAVLA